MRFKSNFFFVFFLALPLVVAATTINTENSYSPGETVTITGTCDDPNVEVGLRALLEGENVWLDQETTNADKQYSASFLPPQKGTYTIYSACEGDNAVTSTVCVGTAAECNVAVTEEGAASSTSAPSGGGSGISCNPQWDCGVWSYCNVSLTQGRECTDLKNCGTTQNKPNTTQSCPQCQESWTCSEWSSCIGGRQSRTCVDQNQCQTLLGKPAEQQTCEVVAPPAAPPKQFVPPAQQPPPQIQQPSPGIWDKYKVWLISGPLAFLLLALVTFLLVHHAKKKQVMYNFDELKDWIKKESGTGTSKSDITNILAERTGWTNEEIEEAFTELKEPAQAEQEGQTEQAA